MRVRSERVIASDGKVEGRVASRVAGRTAAVTLAADGAPGACDLDDGGIVAGRGLLGRDSMDREGAVGTQVQAEDGRRRLLASGAGGGGGEVPSEILVPVLVTAKR